MWENYYKNRKDLLYYKLVKNWLNKLGEKESILDVGCGGCPVAAWGKFNKRVALNLEPFPKIKNVVCVTDDWMNYPAEKFSVITCLQVIEHFQKDYILKFVNKIFENCQTAIISVPYKWEKGLEPSHIQDPIDICKFVNLVGKDPIKLELAYNRLVGMFKC